MENGKSILNEKKYEAAAFFCFSFFSGFSGKGEI
jgi:hypothetical protein